MENKTEKKCCQICGKVDLLIFDVLYQKWVCLDCNKLLESRD